MPGSEEWFAKWFDSPYYHLLYKHRDTCEAEFFLYNIVTALNIPHTARIIDIACGRGRHSIYLNSMGYNVVGVDLSTQSIEYAEKFCSNTLHFEVADMRHLPYQEDFDLALNLFTSFGYFDDEASNFAVMAQFNKVLKKGGLLLLDYLNAGNIAGKECLNDEKEIENIKFSLSKRIENNQIVKDIKVIDKLNEEQYFEERVQLIAKEHFEKMLDESGFRLIKAFGDYQLQHFVPDKSERLILLARKA